MSEERRHQIEEKTYAVLSINSINTVAESAGHLPLAGEAAASLGEDASYRLRQVVTFAGQYLRHGKKRRLGTDDFNSAAKEMNVMPVHGHNSQEPCPFKHVKDTPLHFVEDPEVNLADIALGDFVPRNLGRPSIKAHWVLVEGIMKVSQGGSASSQVPKGKEMTPGQMKYYHAVTQALLGKDPNDKRKALRDLRCNANIVPVLPYILNFTVAGIKNMSHDIEHLTTMLNIMRAIIHNRYIYLMHKPYLATMVLGVESCVLEPLAASINSTNDHWVLRDYAARLLSEIVNRWNSPQNHLRFNITKCLKEVFQDSRRPFYSHYGAVMALIALGHKAVEDVIVPYLPVYCKRLKTVMEDGSAENMISKHDSHKVYGALRLAAEKLMRTFTKNFEDQMSEQSKKEELEEVLTAANKATSLITQSDEYQPYGNVPESVRAYSNYKVLYEVFGDSLSGCLPLVECHSIFKPAKKESMVNLGDHNTGKSGEELLENLMEQIQLQEKLDRERKEKELREQKEREELEKERRIHEAAERKKREEQERLLRLRREEEEQRRKRLEMEEAERQKRLKEEYERRRKEREEQLNELNKNRTKPQWQQEIELRRQQLEEEMQYSRMMEARKRQEERRSCSNERSEDEDRLLEDDDESSEPGKKRLRRRKPINYTEKDDDISDLLGENKIGGKLQAARPLLLPSRQPYAIPPHSDISDDSDFDSAEARRNTNTAAVTATAATSTSSYNSPASASESLSLSSMMMINPLSSASKGSLKLKIKRQSTHSASPPYPPGAPSQQQQHHASSSSPIYHSPNSSSMMLSPRHHASPLSVSHSSSPTSHFHYQARSKSSSSGSDKESRHHHHHHHNKRSVSSSNSSMTVPTTAKHARAASASASAPGLIENNNNYDSEDLFYEQRAHHSSNLPPLMSSPGAESSGSDSNPHRKALKLKLKLTPNHTPSE